MNEYIGDSGKELEGAAEQIVESYMGEYMQVVEFFSCASQITEIVMYDQEYMKGWYKDYCARTGQFCDQVSLKDLINFKH